ncbi:unnamed protein product, partial [Oppiella nova]
MAIQYNNRLSLNTSYHVGNGAKSVMADTGRSRGRARGRAAVGVGHEPPPLPTTRPLDVSSLQQTLPSPVGSAGGDNGGNGGSNGAAVRSRAGYRSVAVTRPPQVRSTVGAGGKAVTVVTNYFRLKTPSNAVVYDYRLDFEPEVEARVVRKGLLFNDAVRQAFNDRLVFDGMSNLKST